MRARRDTHSSRRVSTFVIIAAIAVGTVVSVPAYAQDGADPAPLWNEFPLEGDGRAESVPPPTPTPTARVREIRGRDRGGGGPSDLAFVAIGSVLLMGGALVWRIARGRGVARAEPAPATALPIAGSRESPATSNGADLSGISAVVGYISLTNAEHELDVFGLGEQEALIREACAREGWRLDGVVCDDPRALASGRQRPALEQAIERMDTRDVSYLVVSRLDRLGRSAVELGNVLRLLDAHGVTLVSLDYGIDTSTDAGSTLAGVLSGMADAEHDRIAAGTRTGLAAVRAQGRPISRPAVSDLPQLRERIRAMRDEGATLQAIADTLNREGVPTLRGGALWRPSSVQAAAGYKRPRQSKSYSARGDGTDAG